MPKEMPIVAPNPDSTANQKRPESNEKQIVNLIPKKNVEEGIGNRIKALNATRSFVRKQQPVGTPGKIDQKEENNRSNENRSNGKKKKGKQVLSIQDPNAPQTVTSTVTNNQENGAKQARGQVAKSNINTLSGQYRLTDTSRRFSTQFDSRSNNPTTFAPNVNKALVLKSLQQNGAKQARGQVAKSNINTIYVNVGELNGTPLLPIAGAKYMFTDNFGKVFAQFDPSSNNPITFAPNVNTALAVKMLTQAGIDPNNLLTPPKVQANQLTQTKVKPEPVLQVKNALRRKLDGYSNEQNATKRLAIIDNNVNEVKSVAPFASLSTAKEANQLTQPEVEPKPVLQVRNSLKRKSYEPSQEQNDWRLALMLQAEEADVAPEILRKSLDANILKNRFAEAISNEYKNPLDAHISKNHFAEQDTQELDIRNVINKAQALHAKIYKQESLVEDKQESLVEDKQESLVEDKKESLVEDKKESLVVEDKNESLVEDKNKSLVEDKNKSLVDLRVDLREELKKGPQTFDQELERQQQAELKKEARTGTKTFAKSVIDSRQISSPTRTQS